MPRSLKSIRFNAPQWRGKPHARKHVAVRVDDRRGDAGTAIDTRARLTLPRLTVVPRSQPSSSDTLVAQVLSHLVGRQTVGENRAIAVGTGSDHRVEHELASKLLTEVDDAIDFGERFGHERAADSASDATLPQHPQARHGTIERPGNARDTFVSGCSASIQADADKQWAQVCQPDDVIRGKDRSVSQHPERHAAFLDALSDLEPSVPQTDLPAGQRDMQASLGLKFIDYPEPARRR